MTADNQGRALVLTNVEARVMHIVLNRPDKRNAINGEMYDAMAKALDEAEKDDDVRVLLFSGNGKVFCGGNDLMDFLSAPMDPDSSTALKFMEKLVSVKKPVVAAVHGIAVGIGTTMLCHCDLVYAAEDAQFKTPFVSLGLCPEFGSSLLLPYLAGHQRASEVLLLGEAFSARKAYEMGLVNELLPEEKLLEHATKQALKLAELPPASVRRSKALLKRVHQGDLQAAMREEMAQFVECLKSPEAAEAMQAFFQKRKPDFSTF